MEVNRLNAGMAVRIDDAEEIGRIAQYHRKRSGLSRVQLADLAGVGKTSIFDLEHGKETIRFDTLLKILKTLNIQIQFDSLLMEEYRESCHEKG